jgi:hypothetical protein
MLSEAQIQSLFTFCEKHFVKYYDVQVELVDHLASAIEIKMNTDSKITFEKALEAVHVSFGAKGCASLIKEKQKIAKKQSRNLFYRLFRDQFKLPKIITFFSLSILILVILSSQPAANKYFFTAIFLGGPIAILFKMSQILFFAGYTRKKFLIINFSWISSLVFIPGFVIALIRYNNISLIEYARMSFLIPYVIFLGLSVITLIAVWQTLSSVKETLYKNYPEVFLVKR